MKKCIWLIAVVAGLFAFATAGWADPIGPENCDTCFGTRITLEYQQIDGDLSPTEMYRISLTIDFSGYNGKGDYIGEIAPKIVGNKDDLIGVDFVSAPDGWEPNTISFQGLSNNGCSGGSNGFFCDDGNDPFAIPSGVETWVYDVEVTSGKLLTGDSEASIKVHYIRDSSRGLKNAGITSEAITLQQVPEPSATILFGLGLVGLAFLGRKRSNVRVRG